MSWHVQHKSAAFFGITDLYLIKQTNGIQDCKNLFSPSQLIVEWYKCVNRFCLKEDSFIISVVSVSCSHCQVIKWAECPTQPLFSFGYSTEMQQRLKVLRTEGVRFLSPML
jgi:hypothetical protein